MTAGAAAAAAVCSRAYLASAPRSAHPPTAQRHDVTHFPAPRSRTLRPTAPSARGPRRRNMHGMLQPKYYKLYIADIVLTTASGLRCLLGCKPCLCLFGSFTRRVGCITAVGTETSDARTRLPRRVRLRRAVASVRRRRQIRAPVALPVLARAEGGRVRVSVRAQVRRGRWSVRVPFRREHAQGW